MNFYNLIDSDITSIAGRIVSVIGGGGKSTLIFTLAQELKHHNLKVIVTGTTKMQSWQNIPLVLQDSNPEFTYEVRALLEENSIVQVAKSYYKRNRLQGLPRTTVSDIRKYADIVLVEADGSRNKPLKTHREYEPVIPAGSDNVIIVCGAESIGAKLTDKIVHRADLFAKKWQIPNGTVLTPGIIARELTSPHSYLRYVPIKATVAIFINKVDLNPIGGQLLARHISGRTKYQAYLGSIHLKQLEKITTSQYNHKVTD